MSVIFPNKKPVIRAEGLAVTPAYVPVLRNLNFELQAGEFVYLIGKTGSGKTSLLRTLHSDLPVNFGKLEVLGYDLVKIPAGKVPYLRRQIGVIFQDFQLLTDRSALENIEFVMQAFGENKKTIRAKSLQALALANLEESADKMPHEMSGGQQQRLAVARALANNPALLLADEPTGNLDPPTAEYVLSLLRKVAERGTTVILVTHRHGFLKKFPARTLFCENGSIRDISADEVAQKMRLD